MLSLHLEVLERLMELLVFHSLLFLLKCLNFSLLLKQTALNVCHVDV